MFFIDIRELEREKLEFAQRLPPKRLDLGKDVAQADDLETEGSAELVDRDIRLRGRLRTVVEVLCARCLEPVRVPVELEFDLFYQPIQTIAREGEEEVGGADLEIGFYQGYGLMLEDALKEQILLALPMRTLCRPECKGLCPQCGQNWNAAACACPPVAGDERWAPLADLKKH
jgi:uncharacterized protein